MLGCRKLISFVVKNKKKILTYSFATIILVTYFLFQTNFVYEVAGTKSWSVPLSIYRMGETSYEMGYTHEQDVFGAYWLSENLAATNVGIYADGLSRNRVLSSYGMIYRGSVTQLNNYTTVTANSIVFLGTYNVVYKNGVPVRQYNGSEVSYPFGHLNLVYNNGGCEIYKSMP